MNEQLSVETPEQIDINYQKAGIGSRFYAALLDTLLLVLLIIVGTYVNIKFVTELGDILGNWLRAVGGIVVFALFWGTIWYLRLRQTVNPPANLHSDYASSKKAVTRLVSLIQQSAI